MGTAHLPRHAITENDSTMPHPRHTVWVAVPLALFVLLALYYSASTPLWNPPDEERHFAYCEYIARHHQLPVHLYDLEGNTAGMAFHPPLYYAIGSLLCRNSHSLLEEEISFSDGPGYVRISHPAEGTSPSYAEKARSARLLRLYSLALSTLTLLLLYLLVLTVFPGEVLLAAATTLFTATNPQFLHISASVSSDNMAVLLSTACLWILVMVIRNPLRIGRQVACGMLLGLCILSKSFALFYLPVAFFIIVWGCRRGNPIRSSFIIIGTALLVGGWWYVRNWELTGDPLVSKTALSYFPWFKRTAPLSAAEVKRMLAQAFTSFFGYFGAFQFTLKPFHLSVYGCIMILGTAGLYPLFSRSLLTPFQYRALGIVCAVLLGGVGSFLLLNLQYIGSAMGRYLFIVIAPISLLTCAGLWSLMPSRRRNPVLVLTSLALAVLSLDVCLRVLKPAYADPGMVMGNDQPSFSLPAAEISQASTLGQTFIAPCNGLSAIQVMFSNPARPQAGEIVFSLLEEQEGEQVIRRASVPVRHIQDNTRYFFVFPPLDSSRGRKYVFRISAPDLPPGSMLSLWQETRDSYADGSLLLNNVAQQGDLYFTTWHFTGDRPETDWQGKRELVIQQGLYVEIREIQLYYEQSRAFREKTATHRKILRLQQAITNRKAMMKSTDHA